jgi:uncharacterized membrane protein YwzB
MPAIARYASAWSLTLAPVLFFVPALMLAGMGPCGIAHPEVMAIAFLFFVALEVAALPRFLRAARTTGKAVLAIIGMAIALAILISSAVMGYYATAEYWAERSFR